MSMTATPTKMPPTTKGILTLEPLGAGSEAVLSPVVVVVSAAVDDASLEAASLDAVSLDAASLDDASLDDASLDDASEEATSLDDDSAELLSCGVSAAL